MFDDATDPILRRQIMERFVGELMTDRERAKLFGLPEGRRIRERSTILAPEKLICGKNVWIGEGVVLDAQGGLEIGDGTQIGTSVLVWSHTSHRQAIRGKTGSVTKELSISAPKLGVTCTLRDPRSSHQVSP